tara:strand:+ start:2099 stop:3238 length:1140 start_codon:yes stop_codon:yes gene_type:complete
MSKPRHILGISGGKDSAALAIYLNDKYPTLNFEYYFCDTGKELDETYELINNLENYLGKKVLKLENEELKSSNETPFDYYYKSFRGYLPSPQARWCTALMKLKPFEKFVNGEPTVSYVGIRGDEEREGYISRESNIQSIFPFRRNIWSNDVLTKFFNPKNQEQVLSFFNSYHKGRKFDKVLDILNEPITFNRNYKSETEKAIKLKLNTSLDLGIPEFNRTVFDFLKTTEYPLGAQIDYELLDNEDVLVRDDIFKILRETGIGVPKYYEKIEFEVDGQKGEYARSRSGCFFCFFQQKIEWIWLYEQHPELYKEAIKYENADEMFTWVPNESLEELIEPRRVKQIKLGHIQRSNKKESKSSPYLLDILEDTERDGCNTCFL